MRCRGTLVAIAVASLFGVVGATAVSGISSAQVLGRHVAIPAGRNPSKSAKMVCAHEAQKELAEVLGVRPLKVSRPTWASHVYTCHYVYRNGTMTLSVKELSNKAQTTAYYNGLEHQLGDTGSVKGLGQGGFSTTNGDVVVRKDYKVLLIDISQLPAKFAVPPTASSDVAVTVAEVIMSCWSGS
jgi:hypothetical protein